MHAFQRTLPGLVLIAAIAAAPAVHAQAAKPAAAAAPVAVDPEKQKLIDHILTLFHPENEVLRQIQLPAAQTMEKAGIALQTHSVPKDKTDKALKDISLDVQKYVDTVTPIAAASAKKNVGPSVAPLLAQNFSVEELKQLVAMLETPVKSKFEQLVPQMERAVGEKVTADVGPEVSKDIATMTQAAGTKLRAATIGN